MTGHKKFKRGAFVFIVLSGAFILYPFLNWDYFETGPIIIWALKWTGIPLFILTLISSLLIYRTLLAPWDPPLHSNIKQKLRSFFSVTMLTISWTMVLIGVLFSGILISNNLFPKNHVFVKAPVKKYHLQITRNGRKVYHIDFFEKTLNRDVHLTVKRPYQVNEIFETELYVGHWGYLFADD